MSGEVEGELPQVADEAAGEALIGDWNQRPWVLGGLLALLGMGVYFAIFAGEDYNPDPIPWRVALGAFLFFGGIAAAFTLDLGKFKPSAIFATLIGLVMAGIAYNVVRLEDRYSGEEFAFAAGVFFCVLAVPLFQAGFHKTRLATDYRETHFHVWTDAISGVGALAFTGLSWLMLFLLDALFGLVGVEALGVLMELSWFMWMWSAGAFGAALGVLRENLKIIGTLQNVVMLVFSLLAVPMAAGLLIFLVLLMASGGNALWDTDVPSTPILLLCAAGGFVLTNAIIRDGDDTRSKNVVMMAAALVLAGLILPLVVFATIGMGMRIEQRGLSPERIWALIAIAVAAAYGVAAWVAMARGRMAGWAARLRQSNLHLAAVVCVVALVLALPLWDFGSVAARQQVARLQSGAVTADEFDFTALRWDFGDSGRAALARLAAGDGEVARLAKAAKAQTERPWDSMANTGGFTGTLRVQPADAALDAEVRTYLDSNPWQCSDFCVAVDLGRNEGEQREVALVQGYGSTVVVVGNDPAATDPNAPVIPSTPAEAPTKPVSTTSRVELRDETVRYIYVDGKRVGSPVD